MTSGSEVIWPFFKGLLPSPHTPLFLRPKVDGVVKFALSDCGSKGLCEQKLECSVRCEFGTSKTTSCEALVACKWFVNYVGGHTSFLLKICVER